MLVLPAPFGPKMKLRFASSASSTCARHLRAVMRTRLRAKSSAASRRPRLEPHRHHDELGLVAARLTNQTAGIRVGYAELHLIAIDRRESVKQIVDVEANLHRIAAVFDL